MDLRSIINTEAGERPPPKQAAPVTPIQAPPQQGLRDYAHSSHPPPSKHPSLDYGSQTGVAYSPKVSSYQGNFTSRPPAPPPIQAPPQNNMRSPVRSYSVQSPYQHTPSSTMSGAGQYPFPPTHHQTPQSPAQHHQYPPNFQQRDSYSHATPSISHQHPNSHHQASPAPQTPPIGVPGAPHPYLQHQRSQSTVSTSTPTPTSAHSQHQHPQFSQYSQESPVVTNQYPAAQIPQHGRQQSQHSQPGTPLGPPVNQRQSSGGFAQPSSPYQQRGIPAGSFSQYQHSSPAPAPQRLPGTPNAYDAVRPSIAEQQHRRSQSERERSLSVSPKTRLPSQPRGEMPHPPQDFHNNSTKRKMEDREMSAEISRRSSLVDIKSYPQINGDRRYTPTSTASPQPPPKKRIRYTEPPIWARSVRGKNVQALTANRGPANMNGKPPVPASIPTRPETNGSRIQSPEASRGPPPESMDTHPSLLLGPWEDSISGVKPAEQIVTQVADFIFRNVVSRDDLGELSSHGVDIEIEAKLGQFIDSGERISLGVTSECVMAERRQISFRSAMTEHQHKVLNEFLNAKVTEAHPQNPNRSKRRVGIVYVHRREVDKFYDLPTPIMESLPPAIRQQGGVRQARLRVTYDQKTNQILAKIIKVRIADLSIHLPKQPLDCRISINFEMRYDGDIEPIISQGASERHNNRSKDRLSYTQGLYQVDLTQVSMTKPHNGVDYLEKEHELEIEVSTNAVQEQGHRALTGQPNEYLAVVEGLVNNIRVLARAVPSH